MKINKLKNLNIEIQLVIYIALFLVVINSGFYVINNRIVYSNATQAIQGKILQDVDELIESNRKYLLSSRVSTLRLNIINYIKGKKYWKYIFFYDNKNNIKIAVGQGDNNLQKYLHSYIEELEKVKKNSTIRGEQLKYITINKVRYIDYLREIHHKGRRLGVLHMGLNVNSFIDKTSFFYFHYSIIIYLIVLVGGIILIIKLKLSGLKKLSESARVKMLLPTKGKIHVKNEVFILRTTLEYLLKKINQLYSILKEEINSKRVTEEDNVLAEIKSDESLSIINETDNKMIKIYKKIVHSSIEESFYEMFKTILLEIKDIFNVEEIELYWLITSPDNNEFTEDMLYFDYIEEEKHKILFRYIKIDALEKIKNFKEINNKQYSYTEDNIVARTARTHKIIKEHYGDSDKKTLNQMAFHIGKTTKGGFCRGVILLRNKYDNKQFTVKEENDLKDISMQLTAALNNKIVYYKAITDGLTGLYNHERFQKRINDFIRNVNLDLGVFSLIMLDIDHFKKFNDDYGHQTGDKVLKIISRTIKKFLRAEDEAFRYGGEEMAIILPAAPPKEAGNIADRLRKTIKDIEILGPENQNITITVSMGVCGFSAQIVSPQMMIKHADDMLYKAKENGRDRVYVYEEVK